MNRVRVAVVGLGQNPYAARHAIDLRRLIRNALVERRRRGYRLENRAGLIGAADILVSDIVIENIELCVRSVLFLTLLFFLLRRGLSRLLVLRGAKLLKALILLLYLGLVRLARVVRVIVAHSRHAEYRAGVDIHNYAVCVGALIIDIRLSQRVLKIALNIGVDRQMELLTV